MDSWVYFFSKFTHEALLVEALLVFIGISVYLAYFLTKRRKYGVAGKEVPSNLVKNYLAQLMGDAEDLQIQLFGLLGKGQSSGRLFTQFSGDPAQLAAQLSAAQDAIKAQQVATPGTTNAALAANDPAALEKLKSLEQKMAEQAKALDAMEGEKTRLEEEIAVLKTQGAGAGNAGDDNDLAERLKQLEAQLAEYAVIEDDLANLKRLQKENRELKEQLEKFKTGGGPAPAATVATSSPSASTAAPNPAAATTPAAPTEAAPSLSEAALEASFDDLVSQVETSLPAAATAADAASTSPGETINNAKTEEQLQADFEKMLNS